MKRIRTALACALLTACWGISCGGGGGLSSDGGQSGTGVSAIRGTVTAVMGAEHELADIRVSLATTNLATTTDATGRFELRGNISGRGELRFERMRDRLFARTNVVVPAGGVLELDQIVLDSNTGDARPAQERVEFEGIVQALDCAGGSIVLKPKDDDPKATVFTVDVASATIHDNNGMLTCSDLHVGDRAQVRAESNGSTLINADLGREQPEGNQLVQLRGTERESCANVSAAGSDLQIPDVAQSPCADRGALYGGGHHA